MFTNREALRSSAYADDTKLADRQAIYRFVEHPWPSSRGRVLGAVDLTGDETIVDVGCGNGNDQRQLRAAGHAGPILAFDLSVGMLQTLDAGVPSANADVAALPLRDGTADVALAMHMLYHCPVLPDAVAELRRIVRPGGTLLASTNALAHLQELRELWTEALSDAAGRSVRPWHGSTERFPLEKAADVLGTSFDDVRVQLTTNRLLLPEVAPVVAYVASTRDLSQHDVDDATWAAALDLLTERVTARLAAEGVLAITTASGVAVAR